MLIRIDPASRAPIFEQVAASVRGAIVRGEVEAGERLPAARDLSRSLDINLHTVLRAYQMLRDEGVVELRRGRGAVVTAAAPDRSEFVEAMDRLVDVARRLDIRPDVLAVEIRERWQT
ncbi:GntR family transcriptional regulator [Gordonia hankookensis]|uniref:GntR family transcriptional regulator n=1 Tax=Gordonia hankookensis TaxID=589403 RepID=A0ABR7W651_9ACTN|nr:GntR family transcriptional regulator [Gordonia hankookensis]MBD1318306.1 GntR family transcriptional regulator [Gordonia hankookensis]